MLSVAKKIKHSISSNQYHSRLQKLLSSKSYRRQRETKNNVGNFINIALDADYDKHGKVTDLS